MLLNKNIARTILLIFLLAFLSCLDKPEKLGYTGTLKILDHSWLKDKKIFIDPGHGGSGTKDIFRTGPDGITEEAINLRVALILSDMLSKSGAHVIMSRESDATVSLNKRIEMINEASPDVLVSIHHNGSARRIDNVNFPCVFIWGSKKVRPSSFDLAKLLNQELEKIIGIKGHVLSDYSVFSETGTRILRRTKYTCPGVLGEGGFFSHESFSKKLNDISFNQKEAEAYFIALSTYFKKGIPDAQVYVSCSMKNVGILRRCLTKKNPVIMIKVVDRDKNLIEIKPGSLKATLDDIPVTTTRAAKGRYLVHYGGPLTPGGHRLRFYFKNKNNQSSMVLRTSFTININKGDYKRLIRKGKRLALKKSTAKIGARLLISAYRMSPTSPESHKTLYYITRVLKKLKMHSLAQYYGNRLIHFYPESTLKNKITASTSYFIPVDYYGQYRSLKTDRSIIKFKAQ